MPLQLSFSPLNTANSGFGIGWAFKLSRYDLNNHVLSVHTGDTFEVADQGPGELALVYEQKFKAFTFKHIGEANKPRFRITHTNGMIEILEPLRADDRTFLPTRVETRSGLGITLAYDDEKGRLVSIEDDFEQPLLTLVYQGDTQVLMHVHPGSEAEQLFTLKLQGEELRTLVMPASDLADWTFHYDTFDGMRFLRRLIQPYGGEERIFYKESGHQYPGLNHYLPYVTEHQAIPDPQDDTAATIKTTYTYSDKNFLGYGATDVVWDEHYNQDQLYKATDNTYNYHTEVSHYLDDKVLRTVKHTFNRFHLMTEQVTDEAGCIQTLTTQYHDAPGNFASQDVRVQLPSKMTKTWTQTGTQLRRDEPVFTEYDTHGNLVREQFANGMVMVREFYLPEGEEGCPRDPDGFTRNLKSLTVYPAEGAAPAKILRSRCTYRELPVLSTSLALQQTEKWLVANSVQEFEVLNNVETPLRREDITHLDMPDNPFLHGRVDYTTTQLGKTQSRTEWRYEKSKDDNEKLTYLLTTTTLKPHGGTLERTTYSLHSTLRDQLIETQDTNGVKTRYSYDAVNRPSAETVAPDKPPYDATRTYCYGKETKDQRTLWYAQVTDVNGVITRTYHDGLNRPIREERTLRALDDPESETTITRTVSETTYDTLGRVASETLFDYLPAPPDSDNVEEQVIELTSRFSYDAWGQRCQVEQPDRVKRITLFSPFGDDGTHGNLVREQFANGMVMVREFYLPEGEEGCPRDPDGFTRNLKSLTVYPAEGAAPAKILRSRCTYRELPVLSTSLALQQTEKWLVANSVQEFEVLNNVETPLRREDITHLDMPDNPFLHGRVDYTTTQLGKTQSRTEWRYEKSKDDNEKLTYPIYATYVAPGPYAIDDLSVGSSHGELEVILTEADGQVRRFTQPYSSLGNLLREGVWRYSLTAGRYNGAESLERPMFWEGTIARGGIWDSTLYGGVLASEYYRAGALGVARDFAGLGALSFDVTQARTDLGSPAGQVQGHSFAARYGKSFNTGTNLRFAGYRYSTEGYRDFDEAIRERNQSKHYLGNRRSRVEASVYQNFGMHSLSLTLSQDDYWNSTAQRRQYQVQYNTRWGDLGINLFASQALTDNTGENRLFGLSLSLPLEFGHRHNTRFDLQRYDGRYSQRASLNGGLMNNQVGYQVSLSNDQQNNTSGALSLGYQGSNASYGAGYTQGADYRSVSLNASGALLAHGSGIVLGPYMSETSALVHVPDVAGITLEHTPSSQANAQGYLLAPNLRPYRLNSLVLHTDDLSPEIIIDNATQQVVPRRGAIVKASFPTRHVMRMVLTLHQPDGRPLPFGTQITDAQGQALAVVGQAGQALVASDVAGPQQLRAQWVDQTTRECQITLTPGEIPNVNGYRMQTLVCQPQHEPSSPATNMNHQEHTS